MIIHEICDFILRLNLSLMDKSISNFYNFLRNIFIRLPRYLQNLIFPNFLEFEGLKCIVVLATDQHGSVLHGISLCCTDADGGLSVT